MSKRKNAPTIFLLAAKDMYASLPGGNINPSPTRACANELS